MNTGKTSPKSMHPGAPENHTAGNPAPGMSSDDAVNKANVVNSQQRKIGGVSATEILPDDAKAKPTINPGE